MKKQDEAAKQIREFLSKGGVSIRPGRLTLPDGQQWIVFEKSGRQVGIDSASGVWVRESISENWRCISMPCTLSGAIQAVEFLTKS